MEFRIYFVLNVIVVCFKINKFFFVVFLMEVLKGENLLFYNNYYVINIFIKEVEIRKWLDFFLGVVLNSRFSFISFFYLRWVFK